MAFVPFVVVWRFFCRVGVENVVVFFRDWWPFAVRLPTRHGVNAEFDVNPEVWS